MEIFKTFGLDPITLIAQIVNFLIILYVLKRFLYKPLFGVLKKRRELAQKTIDDAKQSELLLTKTKEEEKAIIKKAKTAADEIIKDAKEQTTDILKKAQEEAKEQTDKTLKDARAQIELEKAQAEKQLDTYVMRLSLDLLKKTLNNIMTEKEQSEMVEKAIKVMQKQSN